MNFAAVVLPQLLSQVPTSLACIVGGALALVYWTRHPLACRFLLAGCLVYLIASVGGSLATGWLIARANNGGMMSSVNMQAAAIGLVASLVRAAGIGLLIAAALTGRTPRA